MAKAAQVARVVGSAVDDGPDVVDLRSGPAAYPAAVGVEDEDLRSDPSRAPLRSLLRCPSARTECGCCVRCCAEQRSLGLASLLDGHWGLCWASSSTGAKAQVGPPRPRRTAQRPLPPHRWRRALKHAAAPAALTAVRIGWHPRRCRSTAVAVCGSSAHPPRATTRRVFDEADARRCGTVRNERCSRRVAQTLKRARVVVACRSWAISDQRRKSRPSSYRPAWQSWHRLRRLLG